MTVSRSVLRRFFVILGAIAIVALLATACGGGSSAKASSSSTVKVSEKEWSITVSGTTMTKGQGDVTVPTGNVTFDIKNDGTIDHEFEIQGNGINQKTATIAPGKTVDLKVDLKAGKYEVWCPVSGHKQLGMDGFVTAS